MARSTVQVSVRMDSEIKAQADELFASMGMNMSAVINIFVRQCLREQRLPFRPSLDVPNEETRHAIEETDEMLRSGKLKRYSVEEAFAELEKDD